MTEQEAIDVLLENVPKCCKMVDGRYQGGFDNWDCDMGQAIRIAVLTLQDIQNYREIGTVEECREAVEKQNPKKCVNEFCPDHTHYKCPSCGKIQKTKYGDSEFGCILNYCSNCGQALDENLEEMKNE